MTEGPQIGFIVFFFFYKWILVIRYSKNDAKVNLEFSLEFGFGISACVTIDSPITILVGGAGFFVDAFTHVHQLKRKRRVFILY